MGSYTTPAERWRAVTVRDPLADGTFVYCVKTTGIFCRPICKARLARRANVEFHDNAAAAERAGFRSCKRCRPELITYTPETDKINRACGILQKLPPGAEPPKLEDLAAAVGLTKHHFHRAFKRTTGLTPRDFARLQHRNSTSLNTSTTGLEGSQIDVQLAGGVQSNTSPSTGTPISSLDNELGFTFPIGSYSDELNSSVSPSTIVYDIVNTSHGLLVVAFQGDQICYLDLAASDGTAFYELNRAFPVPLFQHSRLDSTQPGRHQQHIQDIARAVDRPTGEVLDLPMKLDLAGLVGSAE